MPLMQPPSRRDWLSMQTGPYRDQHQAEGYTPFDHAWLTNRGPLSMTLPATWTGRNPWGVVSETTAFTFDQETFSEAVREHGKDPVLYWGNPYPLPNSPLGHYFRKDMSRRLGGALDGGGEMDAEGSGAPHAPSLEEQLDQALTQIMQLHTTENQL
ncbi:hypothetical protein ARMGADRAFT_1081991 [Armillaria gallica]|uniref:Uncharacterized protein n=1 Tax=Armillaria gallica TaxID=47427 RepID=A0A2H3DBN7_ARMGA|nr:hypothetical protein ARMGADRAFT_1081991 [Armillaria gallica]